MNIETAILADLETGQATAESLAENTGHPLAKVLACLVYLVRDERADEISMPRTYGGSMTVYRLTLSGRESLAAKPNPTNQPNEKQYLHRPDSTRP